MMTIGIKCWLRAAQSSEPLPHPRASARSGGGRRSGPIALLLGGAMICSSLAMTTPSHRADAQGLEAGAGLRQGRERDRRIGARQRKAMESAARAAAMARRLNTRGNEVATHGDAAKSMKRRP
jgi:hypothetical protein